MPKIDAPTVAEHRARVRSRLVDAAERILRAGHSQQLTAGAVSAGAGIARNSIYRYVDSVDDLRSMVVERYLPDWLAAVDQALGRAETPAERVVAWVQANLEQAAETGHGWLMEAARALSPLPAVDAAVLQAHTGLRQALIEAWQEVLAGDVERSGIAAALTVGILEAAFRQLDNGAPAELVVQLGVAATRAVVAGLAGADGSDREVRAERTGS